MSWVRLWADMPTDPKWRVVAKRSSRPLSEVISVFVFMLLNAGANAPERTHNSGERGRLIDWSDEDVAAALDLEVNAVCAIREAMQGKTLDGDRLTGWEKRQPKREDGSAERAKKWRERRRTHPNAPERPDTDTDTDTDKESPPVRHAPDNETLPEVAFAASAAPKASATPKATSKAGDTDAGFEAWARVARDYGLPACKSISEGRRKRMAKRLRLAGGPEAFEATLRREIASSGFLRGRKPPKPGSKPFKADVDFILQDTSWDRLVDGFYADAPGTPPATPAGPSSPGATRGAPPEVYVDPQAEDAACRGMTLEEYRAFIARAKAEGRVRSGPVHSASQFNLDRVNHIQDTGKSHGGNHEDAH